MRDKNKKKRKRVPSPALSSKRVSRDPRADSVPLRSGYDVAHLDLEEARHTSQVDNFYTPEEENQVEIIEKVAEEVIAGHVSADVFKLIFDGVMAATKTKVVIGERTFPNSDMFAKYLDEALATKNKEVIEDIVDVLLFPTLPANDIQQESKGPPDQSKITVESTMQVLQALGLMASNLRFGPTNPSGQGTTSANTLLPGNQEANTHLLAVIHYLGVYAKNFNSYVMDDPISDSQKIAESVVTAVFDVNASLNTLLRSPGILDDSHLQTFSGVNPFINLVVSLANVATATLVNGTEQEIYDSVKRSFLTNLPYVMDSALRGAFRLNSIGTLTAAGVTTAVSIGNLVAIPIFSLFTILTNEAIHRIDLVEKEKLHANAKGKLINESDVIVKTAAKIDSFYAELDRQLAAQPKDEATKQMIGECHRLRQAARESYQKQVNTLRGEAAETGSDMQAYIKRRNVQRIIDSMDATINIVGVFFPPVQLASVLTVSMNLSMGLFGNAMIRRAARGNFNLRVFDHSIILSDKVSGKRGLLDVSRIADPNIILMDAIIRPHYYPSHYNKDKKYHVRNNKTIVENIFQRSRQHANILLALPHDIKPLRMSVTRAKEKVVDKYAERSKSRTLPKVIKRLLAKLHARSEYRKWMQNADLLEAVSARFAGTDFHVNIRNYEDLKKTMQQAGADLVASFRQYQNANPKDPNNKLYDELIRNIEGRMDIPLNLQPTIDEFLQRLDDTNNQQNETTAYIEKSIAALTEKIAAVTIIQENLEVNLSHFKTIANRMPMLNDLDQQINELRKFQEKYAPTLTKDQRDRVRKQMANLLAKSESLRERIVAHDENVHTLKHDHVVTRKRSASSFISQPHKPVTAAAGHATGLTNSQQGVVIDPGLYDVTHAISVRRLVTAAMKQIQENPDRPKIVLIGLLPYNAHVNRETNSLTVLHDRMVGHARAIKFVMELQKRIEQEGDVYQIANIGHVLQDLHDQAKLMFKRHRQLATLQHVNSMPNLAGGARDLVTTATVQLSLSMAGASREVMRPFVASAEQELKNVLTELGEMIAVNIHVPFHAFSPAVRDELNQLMSRIDSLKDTINNAVMRAHQNPERQAFLLKLLADLNEVEAIVPKVPADLNQSVVEKIQTSLNAIVTHIPDLSVAKHRQGPGENLDAISNLTTLYEMIVENRLIEDAKIAMRGFPRLRDVLIEVEAAMRPPKPAEEVNYQHLITVIESAHRVMDAERSAMPVGVKMDARMEVMHRFVGILKDNIDGKLSQNNFITKMEPVIAGLLNPEFQQQTQPLSSALPVANKTLLTSLKEINSTLKIMDGLLKTMRQQINGQVVQAAPLTAEPAQLVAPPSPRASRLFDSDFHQSSDDQDDIHDDSSPLLK